MAGISVIEGFDDFSDVEPTTEELVEGMEDLADWNLMICINCKIPFDLLEAITSDGCKCPRCGKYHGELI